MTFTQTWIIEGTCLGSFPCRSEWAHAQLEPPASIAYFCPHCVDIWARRLITPETKGIIARVFTISCSKHESRGYALPGSILLPWDRDFYRNLPLPLLKREVELWARTFPAQ